MKVALVHELLTMKGGAERVLRVIAEMFPDAPIYTLLYNEYAIGDWFPRARVQPSALQDSWTTHYSLLTTHSINHHHYLSRFPSAVEQWPFHRLRIGDTEAAGRPDRLLAASREVQRRI